MTTPSSSTSTPKRALDVALDAALTSRENRWIRRRLPDPATSSPTSSPLIDFNSNDYLSLSSSPSLRNLFLKKLQAAPDILGSGGSRLLVNGRAHSALESRLAKFFGGRGEADSPAAALLFNSGFDANVGVFSCVPQAGDILVYDEYVHASVHDGMRSSRVKADDLYAFAHNSLVGLRALLLRLKEGRQTLREGRSSVFLAVESLYSMDGTFAPLKEMVEMLEEIFPMGNGYFIVDEAHSTGLYGPQGKGRVAMFGLQNRVLVRLHTFGKALAASGAVVITTPLVKDYLLNYARSLIYTTSLSYANIIAADCSFDMVENGTAQHLSSRLLSLSSHFTSTLNARLRAENIPQSLISLPIHLLAHSATSNTPSPIIPILTPHPRPLSAYLLALGINARPITWPTVPKGMDRVRVCIHAGNTREEVESLIGGVVRWAKEIVEAQEREVEEKAREVKVAWKRGQSGMAESKL